MTDYDCNGMCRSEMVRELGATGVNIGLPIIYETFRATNGANSSIT